VNENPRLETQADQFTELEKFHELLGNPERILGFPTEALFKLDILTKNYPSVFYPTSNAWNKKYRLVELVDPQQPGRPFSNVTGYSFTETQRLKRKYPDSLEIAQAEVGLSIQAYCLLALNLLRKAGRQASITPVAREQGVLTLGQLIEQLADFQHQVSQAISDLEQQGEINTNWLSISESDLDHSIVKLALLVRIKEQINLRETTGWTQISNFLDQVAEYEPIDADGNFKIVVIGALLNISDSGLHTVSFRIREYLCTSILGLSGVFQFDQILELLRARETRKQAEIRKEVARQRASTRLERLRGKGSLEGRSLLPQPPEGVNTVDWLNRQEWYRKRIIQGAAKNADQSELSRAYPNNHYLYEDEYYQKTLEKARKIEVVKPGLIAFLLRFGVTQLLRYEEDDLLNMYANYQFGKSDVPLSDYYLHLCDTHDHNNAHLVNGKALPSEYRKQGKVKPLFCEFDSPLELYKILMFAASITIQNPKSVSIRAHGGVGTISYPVAITTTMVDLIIGRIQAIVGKDERIAVLVESCHAADRSNYGSSFAEHISELGMGVFAPEGLSYGVKSAEIDSDGYVTDVLFKAYSTKHLKGKKIPAR
jgi:hypothetical protein